VAAERAEWRTALPGWDPAQLVLLEETGTHTALTRRYGGGPRDQRGVGSAPWGPWTTTTFLSALRQEGFTAPWVIDGPLDGALFRADVEQHLAPTRQAGDRVILDNLSSHQVAGLREAIEARGAQRIYLPPYSPDLNSIEKAFAQLKARLRQAEERTVAGLWSRIGQVLDPFSPTECRRYFRHCGYAAIPI
jgi:transposase